MEHIGQCICHFTITELQAQAARAQALAEEVEAGEGDFFHGVPGEYEWEATGGAVKWWPRWGEKGEASLFADFYFTPGDLMVGEEGKGTVHVCTDVYQPSPLMEHDEACPWYSMPEGERVTMAYRAFWGLVARGLSQKMETILEAICNLDATVGDDVACRQRRRLYLQAQEIVRALHPALAEARRRVPPAGAS